MYDENGPDPYVYSGTDVLINRFDLRDNAALAAIEGDLVTLRLFELNAEPPLAQFTLGTLCFIHRRLFSDIYPWAGDLRTVTIAKGDTLFGMPQFIESYARELFARLAHERYLVDLDNSRFVARLAHFFGELNALHPFREGNGRAVREFLRQLAQRAGYTIAWERVAAGEIVAASIAAMCGDHAPIEALLTRITSIDDETA